MTTLQQQTAPATLQDIRDIVGPCDDDFLASIVALGATREEVLEAFVWLSSDDYLHRKLRHSLTGRPALVFDLLEAKFPENNRR